MSFAPVRVEDLLRELGIAFERKGTKLHALCPNPDHADRNPSWMIRDDPGAAWHGSHVCKSCGFSGGPWELVEAVRQITLEEAAAFVRRHSGGELEAVTSDVVPRVRVQLGRGGEYELPPGVEDRPLDRWLPAARDYLFRRRVTPEQIERWAITYAIRGPLAWRIVIPVVTRGHLVAYVGRAFFDDGRKRYDMPTRADGARPDAAVFGEPAWDRSLRVATVCEGSFSGLALMRAGAPNVGALLGSDLTPRKVLTFTSPLEGDASGEPWATRILVATDPDAAGEKAYAALGHALGRRAEVVRVPLELSPDDTEDEDLAARVSSVVG